MMLNFLRRQSPYRCYQQTIFDMALGTILTKAQGCKAAQGKTLVMLH